MAMEILTRNTQPITREVVTLPASSTKLSGPITLYKPNLNTLNRYCAFRIQLLGTLAGTNIDVDLMGGFEEDGSDAIVAVANLVTALTGNTAAAAVKDLNATPYPFYFIRFTVDTDESANGVQVDVFGPTNRP